MDAKAGKIINSGRFLSLNPLRPIATDASRLQQAHRHSASFVQRMHWRAAVP
jgi:hypothetical protein